MTEGIAVQSSYTIEQLRSRLAEEEPSITFIIPAYREGKTILRTLESLYRGMLALGIARSPIFLSDSTPDDTTVEAAEGWAKATGAYLVVNHSYIRRSPKAALNVALDYCDTDLIVTTNADAVISKHSLSGLLGALLSEPRPMLLAVGLGQILLRKGFAIWLALSKCGLHL